LTVVVLINTSGIMLTSVTTQHHAAPEDEELFNN